MGKRPLAYAIPEDRENLAKGVFLLVLPGAPRDHQLNRQRAFEVVMERFREGEPPFNAPDCFANGLSSHDLIFVSSLDPIPMSPTMTDTTPTPVPIEHDIIVAANEILELASLKVELAKARRSARPYHSLITKIVAEDQGHLSEEECQMASDKVFAKTIKSLAEARVKVDQWYQTASGKHELILNELAVTEELFQREVNGDNGSSAPPSPQPAEEEGTPKKTAPQGAAKD